MCRISNWKPRDITPIALVCCWYSELAVIIEVPRYLSDSRYGLNLPTTQTMARHSRSTAEYLPELDWVFRWRTRWFSFRHSPPARWAWHQLGPRLRRSVDWMAYQEVEGRALGRSPRNPSTSGMPLAQFLTNVIWSFWSTDLWAVLWSRHSVIRTGCTKPVTRLLSSLEP